MSEMIQIEYEYVGLAPENYRFFTAGGAPRCLPKEVPDNHWSKASRLVPVERYEQLKEWAWTGEQFVRNVRIVAVEQALESTPSIKSLILPLE